MQCIASPQALVDINEQNNPVMPAIGAQNLCRGAFDKPVHAMLLTPAGL